LPLDDDDRRRRKLALRELDLGWRFMLWSEPASERTPDSDEGPSVEVRVGMREVNLRLGLGDWVLLLIDVASLLVEGSGMGRVLELGSPMTGASVGGETTGMEGEREATELLRRRPKRVPRRVGMGLGEDIVWTSGMVVVTIIKVDVELSVTGTLKYTTQSMYNSVASSLFDRV
jgi:hypothetical protein